jgi:hypothetical protein
MEPLIRTCVRPFQRDFTNAILAANACVVSRDQVPLDSPNGGNNGTITDYRQHPNTSLILVNDNCKLSITDCLSVAVTTSVFFFFFFLQKTNYIKLCRSNQQKTRARTHTHTTHTHTRQDGNLLCESWCIAHITQH